MRRLITVVGFVGLLALGGCASSKGSSAQEKREYTQTMAKDTLAAVYKEAPEAKKKVEDAAGYGCFSNIGTNIIFVSTGGGFGMVHDDKSGKDTYMKMGEIGVGLGLGVKDFRALIIFKDEKTLNKFITSGWEWGAEADAAAKSGDTGGAGEAAGNTSSGMEVYQVTKTGVILGATISGTKYWPDKELNK